MALGAGEQSNRPVSHKRDPLAHRHWYAVCPLMVPSYWSILQTQVAVSRVLESRRHVRFSQREQSFQSLAPVRRPYIREIQQLHRRR